MKLIITMNGEMMGRSLLGLSKILIISLFALGCGQVKYRKTVDKVEIEQFMGDWYVIAGRVTFLEEGAYNPLENYKFNKEKEIIEVTFTFNKDSLDGDLKTYTQKGFIINKDTNAYWKVSPFWPLKLDYLVIGLDEEYKWTAIGVPSQRYLWIMSRDKNMSKSQLDGIINQLTTSGYNTEDIVTFEHSTQD